MIFFLASDCSVPGFQCFSYAWIAFVDDLCILRINSVAVEAHVCSLHRGFYRQCLFADLREVLIWETQIPVLGLNQSIGRLDAVVTENSYKWFSDTFDV